MTIPCLRRWMIAAAGLLCILATACVASDSTADSLTRGRTYRSADYATSAAASSSSEETAAADQTKTASSSTADSSTSRPTATSPTSAASSATRSVAPAANISPTAATTVKPATTAKPVSTTAAKAKLPSSSLPSSLTVGYYSSWSAYSGFTPDKIKASLLDVVHYAFADVGSDLTITVGDAAVDYTNFAKLKALKVRYPQLVTLISVGGWNSSSHFSDMAMTDATRLAFARSVAAFIKQHGFDGVDIDWEYPVSGGSFGRAADKTNFTLLMKTLRTVLDEQGRADGKRYYVTFAGGASNGYLSNIELSRVSSYIDYALVMTYDLHGPWDGYADFNAPLYTPAESSPQYQISADSSVRAWLSAGIPASKLVMGIPFYGYVYSGTGSVNNGLYQPYVTGKAKGYDTIVSVYRSNTAYTLYRHSTAAVPYLFGNNTFISYDDAQSVAQKAQYARVKGLRGTGAWELSYDRSAVLLSAIS